MKVWHRLPGTRALIQTAKHGARGLLPTPHLLRRLLLVQRDEREGEKESGTGEKHLPSLSGCTAALLYLSYTMHIFVFLFVFSLSLIYQNRRKKRARRKVNHSTTSHTHTNTHIHGLLKREKVIPAVPVLNFSLETPLTLFCVAFSRCIVIFPRFFFIFADEDEAPRGVVCC